MSTITTVYAGNLRTRATHNASGNTIITDAPLDNNGRGEAFSPTDLVCAALGSCMLTIMGIAAGRHDITLDEIKIQITKIMAADPRRISEIKIDFNMQGPDFSEKNRSILDNAARTCPVALSLHPDLKQTITFNYSQSAS